ncbi:MAG: NADH-quinone oxidoreductase subunit L [Alphaproteobacteria bacterium]|nr:NADH-quinone oxidoreductase subunit L [Alphaproteobacteria bacterium]
MTTFGHLLPTLAVLLPLLGALLGAASYGVLKGQALKNWADGFAMLTTTGGVLAAAACSWLIFVGLLDGTVQPSQTVWLEWLQVGGWQVDFGVLIDRLSATMLIVVTTVSACVHVYSVGYMAEDPSRRRFFIYLSLFTFAMLMLVTAPNLLQMFLGWEGVGVCSYLLINFWYHKPSANAAAIKAFVVNRVADAAMLVGLFLLLATFGSLTYAEFLPRVAELATEHQLTLNLIALLLFIGAMGKSAQFGLHTWLPDAMEGPTPVSALIHAATMVTAGVFLLCRLSPLYEATPEILHLVGWVGALTALFAATVGLTQTDIKRVIAYSTCSQLGYMFFAIGVSAYPAAMFHLTTHAFFKALLFLGAGSVIHAAHHEQDIFKLGGLRKPLMVTYVLMWLGSLALAGIPPFAGFFSKDGILESAFMAPDGIGWGLYAVGTLGAFLTAIYGFRILFYSFEGQPHHAHHHDEAHTINHQPSTTNHSPHESPWIMLAPMLPLAVGAVVSGYLLKGMLELDWWQGAIAINNWTESGLHHIHHTPVVAKFAPLILAILGITLAWYLFAQHRAVAKKIAQEFSIPYAISFNKWYIDELYELLWQRPLRALANELYRQGDGRLIDGVLHRLTAEVLSTGLSLRQLQSGNLYHYALAMLLAVVAAFAYVLWGVN